MGYREIRPDGALSPYVRCFWTLTPEIVAVPGDGAGFETLRSPWMLVADPLERYTEQLLPDGSLEIAFHLGDPVFECPRGARPRELAPQLFVGQLTRPVVIAPGGRLEVVGIRFRPAGAAVFLHANMRQLRDRFVPLREVAPALAAAAGRLAEAAGFDARARILGDVLQALLLRGVVGRPDPAVFGAAELLEASDGAARIEDVAAAVGVSGRRLLRLFNRHVGISPKLLARIIRFQRVFRALRCLPDASWSEVALEAGYYDQAHLVREFRAFAGMTPEAFLREWNEIVDWLERDAA